MRLVGERELESIEAHGHEHRRVHGGMAVDHLGESTRWHPGFPETPSSNTDRPLGDQH